MLIARMFLFISCIALLSCNDNHVNEIEEYNYPLSLKPKVEITDYNYDRDSLFNKFASPEICNEFLNEYYKNFNDSIKQIVIDELTRKFDSLKLDYNLYTECYNAIRLENDSVNVLPVYLEKAKYNNKDVWNISAVIGLKSDTFKLKDIISFCVETSSFNFFQIQDYLPVKPIVQITTESFDSTTIMKRYSNTEIWNKFKNRYNYRWTYKLRENIMGNISEQISYLNIDAICLNNCFNVIGDFHYNSIPCLIESIEYEDRKAWVILYIWGFGFNDLQHIRFYVLDEKKYEILYWNGCL